MRYRHYWKTDISSGSQVLDMDLLEAIHAIIKYGKQFPEVVQQKIVNCYEQEICVFRDACFNGK